MAISIDWATKVIFVPKADTTLVQSSPTEIRSLDINTFRLTLKDLEDDAEGMPFLDTHNHVAPIDVGGVTLARVIEIINGYTVTFEDDQYAVNLVGANSNIGDVVNVNQVSVRSANSAGLTYSKEIEDQSFTDARVWVDTVDGLSGIAYPRGTPGDPTNTILQGVDIIEARSLPKRIQLLGSEVLTSGSDYSSYDIKGEADDFTTINIESGVNTSGLLLEACKISGYLSGNIVAINDCTFSNVYNFEGDLRRGGLEGTVYLSNSDSVDEITFVKCYSNVAGTGTPKIDARGLSGMRLNVRGYHGGLQISGFSGPDMRASIDVDAANVIIDSSCTSGTIVLRGLGTYTDDSGPGCTVVASGFNAGGSGVVSGITGSSSMEISFFD